MNLDKKYFGTVCSVSYSMTITTTPITTCYVLYLVKVSGMPLQRASFPSLWMQNLPHQE